MYYYFLHWKWETATEGKSESRGTKKQKKERIYSSQHNEYSQIESFFLCINILEL